MTIEEAKTFLDNLKVCIEEHPIVADWLVEIADRKTEPMTTNLEWLKTLSAEELADWFYDEWLHHLQYRWSSSRGGLIIWLKDRKTENSSEKPNNSTRSKMEQVDKEYPRCVINGTPFDECGFCEHFNCDTCKCEAQTERSSE